jgi:protein TonB
MPPDPARPVPHPDIAQVEDPVVEAVEPPSVETTPRPRTTDDEAMAELAMLSQTDVTPHPMAAALPVPAVEPEEAAEPAVVIAAPLPDTKPQPAPQPQSDPQPVSSAAPTEVASAPVKATAGSIVGAGGASGAQDNPDAGAAAQNSTGGGTPGIAADYVALLQAWLEKHKEYPYRAQVRHEEGVALLFFVMDRDGRVLEFRITQSSGSELLDREVADMIERAQPLPKMPDSMTQTLLKLVVPVQFFLQ